MRRQIHRGIEERTGPSGIMSPHELNLGLHGIREVPSVAGRLEDRLHLAGSQQVDQAAGIDEGWR